MWAREYHQRLVGCPGRLSASASASAVAKSLTIFHFYSFNAVNICTLTHTYIRTFACTIFALVSRDNHTPKQIKWNFCNDMNLFILTYDAARSASWQSPCLPVWRDLLLLLFTLFYAYFTASGTNWYMFCADMSPEVCTAHCDAEVGGGKQYLCLHCGNRGNVCLVFICPQKEKRGYRKCLNAKTRQLWLTATIHLYCEIGTGVGGLSYILFFVLKSWRCVIEFYL